MKFKLILIIALFLVFPLAASALDCGDCNGDNNIDILDALIAARHGAGINLLSSPYFESCNVEGILGGPNRQGAVVDILDSLKIARYAASQIPSLDCVSNYRIAFSSIMDNDWEIYTIDQDGNDLRLVTINQVPDEFPSWSPDGNRIVYGSYQVGNSDLYIAENLNNGIPTIRRLTNDLSIEANPSWSVNNEIVFRSNRDGNYELYKMNFNNRVVTRLTNNNYVDDEPSWSPDGNKIVFIGLRQQGNLEIIRINSDGSKETQLTNDIFCEKHNPSFSPNGKYIAFDMRCSNAFYPTTNIWLMNSDGTNMRQITNGYVEYNPTWSRDGSEIIYSENTRNFFELVAKNIDTGAERLLTPNISYHSISPAVRY